MVRCTSCGNELYSRRLLDTNGKATGGYELVCRNPNCPDEGRRREVDEAELTALEEEEVAQWGV